MKTSSRKLSSKESADRLTFLEDALNISLELRSPSELSGRKM
jgi:hypothetical protein